MQWIPLLAASMNPEETPLFRKELTGETHKAEGDRVRGREERRVGWGGWGGGGRVRSSGTRPGYTVNPWGQNAAKETRERR